MIDMNNIEQLKTKFIGFKSELKLTLNSLDEKEKNFISIRDYNDNLVKARIIISEAGKFTQTYLKEYIEEMVTTALQAVFEEEYRFIVDFDIKRNRPEAKISLKIHGEEVDPKDSVGGGVLDVASFALRIVLYSIQNPKSNNVIILDEPLKFLHGKMENAMKMIKDLSKKLGIQFIIVSQIPEIAEQGDKVFEVIHNGKFSEIKEMHVE